MSSTERPVVAAAALPARLALALGAAEPEASVREVLSRSLLPPASRERLLEQSLLLGKRGRQREPRASASELQLALGVLLALCGPVLRREVIS